VSVSTVDKNSDEWRRVCLARYLANHPDPRYFAGKLAKRHGEKFVDDLRDLLRKHGRG